MCPAHSNSMSIARQKGTKDALSLRRVSVRRNRSMIGPVYWNMHEMPPSPAEYRHSLQEPVGSLDHSLSDISGDRFGTVKDCSVVSLDDQERIHGMELVIVAQRTSSSDVDDPLDEVPHFLREN